MRVATALVLLRAEELAQSTYSNWGAAGQPGGWFVRQRTVSYRIGKTQFLLDKREVAFEQRPQQTERSRPLQWRDRLAVFTSLVPCLEAHFAGLGVAGHA